MASLRLQEFLENSTIHGLAHISTSKSRATRVAWVAIVVACFALAIYMITSSYKEWQESPVSTTITTHPIIELEFPTGTVCPPRGSNTALNHLLEKVKDVNFTKEERQELLDISKEVFIEIPNMMYAQNMTALLSSENMRSIANGQSRMPAVDEQGTTILKSSEPQGSISSSSLDFGNTSFKYELNFPENIGELVGEGELVISVETKGNWSFFAPKNTAHLYKENLTASAAEEVCVDHEGHLASVGSQEEQGEIQRLAEDNEVWMGGRRKTGDEWEWLDGRAWNYQNWFSIPELRYYDEPKSDPDYDCMYMLDGTWRSSLCDARSYFICVNKNPIKIAGNHTLLFKSLSLENQSLYFWWNKSTSETNGFKLSWQIKNGDLPDVMEFVSSDLEGSISTPGLGLMEATG